MPAPRASHQGIATATPFLCRPQANGKPLRNAPTGARRSPQKARRVGGIPGRCHSGGSNNPTGNHSPTPDRGPANRSDKAPRRWNAAGARFRCGRSPDGRQQFGAEPTLRKRAGRRSNAASGSFHCRQRWPDGAHRSNPRTRISSENAPRWWKARTLHRQVPRDSMARMPHSPDDADLAPGAGRMRVPVETGGSKDAGVSCAGHRSRARSGVADRRPSPSTRSSCCHRRFVPQKPRRSGSAARDSRRQPIPRARATHHDRESASTFPSRAA